MSASHRPQWASSFGFILAAAGSAVGLGNLWKFPYIVGINGGGAFVLVYLFCISLVGIPVLLAEIFIGQQGQANVVKAYEKIHRPNSPWKISGLLGLISAFLILSFYGVVGGWILDFEFQSLFNNFTDLPESEVEEALESLFKNPTRMIFLHFVFMLLTTGIVLGGVQKGIERWNKILMPGLGLLLLCLLGYSISLPGFSVAIEFLFLPNFSKLSWSSVLEAVGHSFFTLSIGVGVMVTYGSYLSKKENLPRMVFSIAIIDTLMALASGVIIFSAVYSYDIDPVTGPTLIFQTLPVLFTKMPGGYFISISFFLLVAFTALTSSISILEVVVAFFVEKFSWNRFKTTLFIGFCAFFLGILSDLSYNVLSHVKILGLNFFDFLNQITSSLFLPISGLLTSLFIASVMGQKAITKILHNSGFDWLKKPLTLCLCCITPISIFIILINNLDWLW